MLYTCLGLASGTCDFRALLVLLLILFSPVFLAWMITAVVRYMKGG